MEVFCMCKMQRQMDLQPSCLLRLCLGRTDGRMIIGIQQASIVAV